MRGMLWAAWVVACHPTSPTASRAVEKTQACPASFSSTRANADCDALVTCPFAEGTCSCTTGSYCGGIPPSEKIKKQNARLRWVCDKKPPAVREDGCPGAPPTGPCTGPKECRYSDGCCFVEITCLDGSWKPGDHQCPP